MMKRIFIYCEGTTEETFVREILQPYFNRIDIFVTAKNMNGGNTYGKIKKEITRFCKQDSSAYITSMIDLYGLPHDFPHLGMFKNEKNPLQKVKIAEQAFKEDINQKNFIPNIILHEFEALLFSDLSHFPVTLRHEIAGLNPEEINDSAETAPSKRILQYLPSYRKITNGNSIAKDIGLDTIRQKCPHFNDWLQTLQEI